MTNGIAHELRTPLTPSHPQPEAIESARAASPCRSPRPPSRSLDATVLELDGLLSAFGALLRIAYIDAGTLRSSFKEFELSETLAALAEDFEPIARDGGKRLTAQIAPGLRFFGDKRLVVQMIVNLLENAIAHSGGDQIALSAETTSDGIEVRVRPATFPEPERKKVFQRFYRLKKESASAGYGLVSAWSPRSPSSIASASP